MRDSFGMRAHLVAYGLLGALVLAPLSSMRALHAQTSGSSSDSTMARGQAFPFEEFERMVRAYHPEAEQARLVGAQARSELTIAWGAFDPKLAFGVSDKVYKNDTYYRYSDASLTLPLPVGSGIKFGFERALGSKINPDRSTPANGLLTLGLSLPLARGIITDERRTALTQARAGRDLALADQQALLNKLLVRAAKAYGDWYGATRRAAVAREGVRLATFRADATRERVRAGDNAPVDTLEAMLEVRRRRVTALEAETELRNATLIASTFLWDDAGRPIELPGDQVPTLPVAAAAQDTLRVREWIRAAEQRHPDLLKADAKVRVANADRTLAAQGMLPDADVTAYAIGARDDAGALTQRDGWRENSKRELSATTSLLLLKERGKFSATAQKLEFTRLDRDLVRRDVASAVRIALNELTLLDELIIAQRENLQSATALRDAEQRRLDSGESNLLTVNLRERLVLDESVKLATLEGKLVAARATLGAAVGDPALVR